MSWFNDVTGTNDYERQSWRDSYNGGRAAGDWTGNVNARLDQERSDFQGATWSGSSSQYSAIELAQRSSGVGQPIAVTGAGASKSSGPGNEVVAQGVASVVRPAGGSGAASRLTISGPLTPNMEKKITQFMVGGLTMHPDPRTSNMAEVEDRWGDAEFMSPAWFASWSIAATDAWYNADVERGGPLRTGKIATDLGSAGSAFVDGVVDFAGFLDERRTKTTARAGSDGRTFYTGGGF